MTTARALLLTCLFAAAWPAGAQYYPPPPPPAGPPPAPPGPPPAYPPYAPPRGSNRPPPRYVLPDPAPANTVRLGLGFTFANDAYDCWYFGGYYGGGYSCGYGYGGGVAWPNLNLEADIGLSQLVALTVGGNVFGGDWNGVSNTVWEPHVDVMFRSSPYSDMRGRLRLGLGLYAATADQGGLGGSRSETGGAFRIGVGGSFFARSTVGLGIDAIFEAGSIGGYYVSTLQLMIGPEFHF